MVIVITGHRPKNLWNIYDLYNPLYIEIAREMRKFILDRMRLLDEGEKIILVSGMALGIDTLFALVAIKLKKEYPLLIELHCEIPCKGQPDRWSNEDKKRYIDILSKADVKHYTSQGGYTSYLIMYKRDEMMVDKLTQPKDYLLAVWNSVEVGGTYHTISYAKKQLKQIHIIDPLKYKSLIY